MPSFYELRRADRLICCRFTGQITARECIDLIDRVRRDPLYDPTFSCLVDNRELAGGFRREDLHQIVRAVEPIFASIPARPRVAVVAGSELQYGVTRMFQILADAIPNLDLRVFRDLREAEAWVAGTPWK